MENIIEQTVVETSTGELVLLNHIVSVDIVGSEGPGHHVVIRDTSGAEHQVTTSPRAHHSGAQIIVERLLYRIHHRKNAPEE
ncbi:hypothetical protein [Deinococcus peraridilitoris]|uniref:hypothetical protein n=1 Tax=Deinococcus peraridilitoris TaxID=432329 RepID=UPI0002E8E535|nr:hypothetical protein [Deinococcus peraridilitoris]